MSESLGFDADLLRSSVFTLFVTFLAVVVVAALIWRPWSSARRSSEEHSQVPAGETHRAAGAATGAANSGGGAPAAGGAEVALQGTVSASRSRSGGASDGAALASGSPPTAVEALLPGGDLYLLRAAALTRLLALHVEAAEVSKTLQRRIWKFLDDRPRFVVTGCADGQARLYDVKSGRMLVSVRHLPGEKLPLGAVHLAPDLPRRRPQLFTASWDGKWHKWDSWPLKPARPTEFARGEKGVGHENVVTGLALNRDGRLLAVGCSIGRVLVYRSHCPTTEVEVTDQEDLNELREALHIGDYSEMYLKAPFMLAGTLLETGDQLLAEASFEGRTSRRDVIKLDLPARLRFRFVGCCTRGHKRAWRLLEHDGAVKCIALAAEGSAEFLYSGGRDRVVKKWALRDGACVSVYSGHGSMVRCLAVNSAFLATGSDDRTLRIWEIRAATCLRTIAAHTDFVRSVSLCPSFVNRLLSSGDDLRVVLWDASTGERLLEVPHTAPVPALRLDGSLIFTVSDDGRLRVWHTEMGTLLWQAKHPGPVCSLSLL